MNQGELREFLANQVSARNKQNQLEREKNNLYIASVIQKNKAALDAIDKETEEKKLKEQMNLRYIERQIQEKNQVAADNTSITHKGVGLGSMDNEEYRMNKRLLKQIRA